MKQKATMIIKNLKNIYTMERDSLNQDLIFSDAFIAIYHDDIMEIGNGDYDHYVDKDTRILDGTNQIAIPGMIDLNLQPKPLVPPRIFKEKLDYETYYFTHPKELVRDMHSLLYEVLKHGCTTFCYATLKQPYKVALECVGHEYWQEYKELQQNLENFTKECLSCHYDPITFPCMDPLYVARCEYQKKGRSAMEILKQFTCNPAQMADLTHIGTLKKGKQADILLLYGPNLDYVLHHISMDCLRCVIKKGTQQFPNVLI